MVRHAAASVRVVLFFVITEIRNFCNSQLESVIILECVIIMCNH